MKNNFKLFVFVFIFSLSLFLPYSDADPDLPFFDPEKTISMDFQDASLKNILKIFSIQSGLNFIASQEVQDRTITLYLDNVSLKEAMNKLFKANNLSYELDKEAKIFIVKDWGKLEVETITKVFYLKYQTVPSSQISTEKATSLGVSSEDSGDDEGEGANIVSAIKKILTTHGKISENARTNSLIITEIPSRMPMISELIASLDVPVPQILIEVEMLDVSKSSVDKIGFKFGQSPITLNMLMKGAAVPSKFPWGGLFGDKNKGITSGSFGISTGDTNAAVSTYQIVLDFLKTQSDTKYLARPRILTLNNETAEIKITTQETIGRTTTSGTTEGTAITETGTPERTETGVSLRVTPQVNLETGEITMFIVPTVKDTSTSSFLISGSTSTYFKDPEERSTKSTVRVKDGETIIIGGLIRNEYSNTLTKLPFFGDLPLVGTLFRHKEKSKDRERELLVFITPHILRDSGIELARMRKLNLPEREQSAATGGNRQLAINASLNNFERNKK